MRRRIQSEPKVNEPPRPLLVSQSRSLNLSPDQSNGMQLITDERRDSNFNESGTVAKPIFSENTENDKLSPSIKTTIPIIATENETLPTCAITAGRPTSLSSVASSRTSRCSDYFSSSSSGPQFDIVADFSDLDSTAVNRPVLNKLEEEVEAEEGFVDGENQTTLKQNSIYRYNENLNKEQRETKASLIKEIHETVKRCDTEEVTVQDINKKLGEVDHLSPIATTALAANPQLTHVDRIILELLETERMYVRALEEILTGYMIPLQTAAVLPLKKSDIQYLFGNVKDIYAFTRKFLNVLENSKNDPVNIARDFVSQDTAFSVYTEYCTNYPISVSVLTRCMKNPSLAQFFKNQQESRRHNLPLGSYLLKPVQRILKYHLIFQELVKKCDKNLENYSIIEEALHTMTNIAQHINDMKKKHEGVVHIQEIQSILANWQGDDLTTYGDIVMEGDLKLQGAKNDRLVILFDKMILIAKRREDGFLVCKVHIRCSDLFLQENVDVPLSFLISNYGSQTPYGNHGARTGKQYLLTAKTLQEKLKWTKNIKKLMMVNHTFNVPLEAQQSILNMDTAGLEDPTTDDTQRPPLRRIASNLSTPQLMNINPRRRSHSTTRKGLALRPWKKYEAAEFSDDISSDSVPNTPTIALSIGRFSFPKFSHSTSPKPDANEETPVEVKKQHEEKLPIKKLGPKRTDKYKDSVIYRRHKRRTSQPITDVEKRLSLCSPTDPENKNENRNELSVDDFESVEDYLSFNMENRRESISWDKQIVEPFFEKLRKEKEESERHLEASSDVNVRNLSNYRKQIESSDSDSSGEINLKKKTHHSENILFESSQVEDKLTAKVTTSVSDSPKVELKQHDARQAQLDTLTDKHISLRHSSNENPMGDAILEKASSFLKQNTEKYNVLKDRTLNTAPSPRSGAKVKRSFSTQSNQTSRRRYFDKLKEMRDRRHSQLSLGKDAKIIQSGKVREMIEHHREQMLASQVQNIPALAELRKSRNGTKPTRRRSDCYDRFLRSKGYLTWFSGEETAKTNSVSQTSVVYRNKSNSNIKSSTTCNIQLSNNTDNLERFREKYKSADWESVNITNRLSTVTTASLPLTFTSSSSSCCSGSGNEDESFSRSPTSTYKNKTILEPQMLLWRSYEDIESNTRRSRNLIIETSPESRHKTGNDREESLFSFNSKPERKFLFKDLGLLDVGGNLEKDKMSEQVDIIWDDLENSANHKVNTKKPLLLAKLQNEKIFSAGLECKSSLDSENSTPALSKDKSSLHSFTNAKKYQPAKSPTLKKSFDELQSAGSDSLTDLRTPGRNRKKVIDVNISSNGKSMVMQLTKQFNQLATNGISSSPRRSYVRSKSASSTNSDLRLSTGSLMSSSLWKKSDAYENVKFEQSEINSKNRENLEIGRNSRQFYHDSLVPSNNRLKEKSNAQSTTKQELLNTKRGGEIRKSLICHSRTNCISAPSSLIQTVLTPKATKSFDESLNVLQSTSAEMKNDMKNLKSSKVDSSNSQEKSDFVSLFCKT